MSALLAVGGLRKPFGGVPRPTAPFEVAAGTMTALIGPNGSGKTTLFNIVTGYLRADAGAVHFDGRDVRARSGRLYRRGLSRTSSRRGCSRS